MDQLISYVENRISELECSSYSGYSSIVATAELTAWTSVLEQLLDREV